MPEALLEQLGEGNALALAGLVLGIAFGFFAQRSRFCLRSAVIEFARNVTGGKLTVWLFAFSTAVIATQALVLAGVFDARDARQRRRTPACWRRCVRPSRPGGPSRAAAAAT